MLQALFYQATSRLHLPTLRLPGANLAAVETLRIPAFRYLWGSYGLAALANQMRVMVIAWLVLELTGSQLWVGLANGLPTIALAGFSLASGVLVDQTSPRRVLFWVRLTMVVATLLTGVLVGAGMVQLWHIILLTSLTGGVYGMDLVASRICVNAVGKERLLNALSLYWTVFNLAGIVGPSVAGILLVRMGADVSFYLMAGAFMLALAALARIPETVTARTARETSALGDLLEGFGYVWRTPHVRWLITLGGAAVLGASFYALLPVHARDRLGMGPEGLGALMGAFGAGGLAGSSGLALRRDIQRKGLALVLAALVMGLGSLLLALSHSFYLSLGCVFVLGGALMVWLNTFNALLQTSVAPEMQGRVVSLNKVLMQSSMVWLVRGSLAGVLGQLATLLLGGTAFVALHLVAYWRTPLLRQAD